MEIQTWLLLTERTTNFTKTDARIAIAGVTILFHLNSLHLPFYQCAIQKKTAKLTNTVFFKFLSNHIKGQQKFKKKYEKYKEQRVNSSRFPPMNQVFFSKIVIA